MKQDYSYLSMEVLCRLFGKTRHAYYDHQWRHQDETIKDDIILQLVHKIRNTALPRLGTRKLLILLKPELETHQIKVGRDYLFNLLQEHKLLIRRRKRKVFTTDSRHWMRKYANLTKDLIIVRPEQLWVSDITYIRMGNQWGYLSLITDAYRLWVSVLEVIYLPWGAWRLCKWHMITEIMGSFHSYIILTEAVNIVVKSMLIY